MWVCFVGSSGLSIGQFDGALLGYHTGLMEFQREYKK